MSGKRWASLGLAIVLGIGWQDFSPTPAGRDDAGTTAGVNTLDETGIQLVDPRFRPLSGSAELWKFRRLAHH